MFYLAVEEYTMQNRQRRLAKDLKLRRQLRDSLESKSDKESYFLVEVSDRLRNLVRAFRVYARISHRPIALPRDCATC